MFSGPLTMISVTESSSSSRCSGPKPSTSSASSAVRRARSSVLSGTFSSSTTSSSSPSTMVRSCSADRFGSFIRLPMRSNSALPTRSLSRARASTGGGGTAATTDGRGTGTAEAAADVRRRGRRRQPVGRREAVGEVHRRRRPVLGPVAARLHQRGRGEPGHQPPQLLDHRVALAAALQQRHALVGRRRHAGGPRQDDVHTGADGRLDVAHRQPALGVGEVHDHVPAGRDHAQLAQHVELLAQPADAGDVHAGEHHDVGGPVQGRQRLLRQPRRGVDDDVAELPRQQASSRVTSSPRTVSPAAGDSAPQTA